MAAPAPKATKSQPTGLYGLREATKAPTVAKGTAVERTRGTRATSLTGHSRNPRHRPATMRAHKGHANQAALRSDSPTPRPCSLARTVTTLLYSTTVSKASRNALRGGVFSDITRAPRGGGVASTAFAWAHASRDNARTEFSRTAAWPGGGHGAGGRRTLAASSGATRFCGRLLERVSIQDLQAIRVNKPRNTAFA